MVDIGVLTQDRKLTEVGSKIESLLGKERTKDNIFYIDEDSYYYLLQFLKLQINNDGLKIKPFIALIYMLYCWFLVISSWSDDKNASKGKKWIKTAAIAIAWVWLAWLIISVMIRFIGVITKSN